MRKPTIRLPLSAKLKAIPEGMAGQYTYKLTFSNEDQAEKVIQKLKSANMSYAVKVKEKKNFFSGYSQGGKKSCALGCVWVVILISFLASIAIVLYKFSDRINLDGVMDRLLEAIYS